MSRTEPLRPALTSQIRSFLHITWSRPPREQHGPQHNSMEWLYHHPSSCNHDKPNSWMTSSLHQISPRSLYDGGKHFIVVVSHDRCHLWHWLFMSGMLMWACSALSFIYLCESHWDCHLLCKEILTPMCRCMRVCTHFNVHLHYHCGTIWMCSYHWGQGRAWLDLSTSGLAEGDPLPPFP